MVPFNKTFQLNILRLPNANILLLISLFCNIYQIEKLFCFYSFTLSSFSSDYALVRFVMFFHLECSQFSGNLKYFGLVLWLILRCFWLRKPQKLTGSECFFFHLYLSLNLVILNQPPVEYQWARWSSWLHLNKGYERALNLKKVTWLVIKGYNALCQLIVDKSLNIEVVKNS